MSGKPKLTRCTEDEALEAFYDLLAAKPNAKFHDFDRAVKFWTERMQTWPLEYVRAAVEQLAECQTFGFPEWAELYELMNARGIAEDRDLSGNWWEREP